MKNGKFMKAPKKKRSGGVKRSGTMILSLLLLLGLTIGGTLAFLVDQETPITNTFTPSEVKVELEDKLDDHSKKTVYVQNTSDIKAYLRVRLIGYRVNDAGQIIGGTTNLPVQKDLGAGWVLHTDGMYYYTEPVPAGQYPGQTDDLKKGVALITEFALEDAYTATKDDPNGGKQVIEVIAEAIQADGVDANGTPAVTDAWGMVVNADKSLSKPAES